MPIGEVDSLIRKYLIALELAMRSDEDDAGEGAGGLCMFIVACEWNVCLFVEAFE